MQKKKKAGILLLICAVAAAGCGIGQKYPDSEVVFDESYRLKGMDNIEFLFSKDSTLTVSQKGIYELEESSTGEPVVRICLDDIARELPEDYNFTDYLLKKEGKRTVLTFTTEEFNLDANPMVLVLLEGEDGLLSGEYFDGTYQIGEDGDSYQYIFEEDGTITMQVREHYFADEEKMTLTDYAGSTDYLYDASEEGLILKNMQGEQIMVLVPGDME